MTLPVEFFIILVGFTSFFGGLICGVGLYMLYRGLKNEAKN